MERSDAEVKAAVFFKLLTRKLLARSKPDRDRSGGRSTLTSPDSGRVYPLRSLWQLDLPTFEPGSGSCPGCASRTPLYAPGSTGTDAGASGPGTNGAHGASA